MKIMRYRYVWLPDNGIPVVVEFEVRGSSDIERDSVAHELTRDMFRDPEMWQLESVDRVHLEA